MNPINSLFSIDSCKKIEDLSEGPVMKRQASVAPEAIRAKSEKFLFIVILYKDIIINPQQC